MYKLTFITFKEIKMQIYHSKDADASNIFEENDQDC